MIKLYSLKYIEKCSLVARIDIFGIQFETYNNLLLTYYKFHFFVDKPNVIIV